MITHKFFISFLTVLVLAYMAEPVRAASDESDKNTAASEQTTGTPEGTIDTSKTPTTPNTPTWGEFDPGQGFLIGRTDFGEMAISAYGLFRYLNQVSDTTFTDHLGNEHIVDPRNDFESQRVMLWLKGWLGVPELRYCLTFWTVNATDQKNFFMMIGYQFNRKFNLYTGYNGLPGTRTMMGSHPYWLAHDRVMADEFFRPYFGAGVWVNGEVLPGLWYTTMVSNNTSILGVKAADQDRKFSYGGSVWWMPTTQEFGPKGGFGDYEMHEKLATRFGMSTTFGPEQRYNSAPSSPQNTILKLADSLNVFETGALAPGVTVGEVFYQILSFDAGMKYKGFFIGGEYYRRLLNNFQADGLVPVNEIIDTGFYVQAAFFPIPQKIELYTATSQIFGDKDAGFDNSSEYLVGMNWYITKTRNHRFNLQVTKVNHSPVGSTFGYYTAGENGYTISAGVSVFF
jgi:hypothetical protein